MPQRSGASTPAAKRVTIRDVAAAAGVSPATVSFVLNDTPGQTITAATQERVRAAAQHLGYAPHGVARALREGRSRIVLLHTGTLPRGASRNSFVEGMTDELRAHDVTLLVVSGRHGIPPEVLDAVAPRAVLDLAQVATGRDDTFSGTCEGYVAGLGFHARTQLRYLVARGHREIAVAVPRGGAGGQDSLVRARLEHVERAARELDLPPVRELRLDAGGPRADRREAVRLFVENTSVTAVAGYDDDVALAVLGALGDLGRSAPDDLAVIGFDEGEHGRLWLPALTTVRIDAKSYGRRAARVALGLDPGQWDRAPSRVVERESA